MKVILTVCSVVLGAVLLATTCDCDKESTYDESDHVAVISCCEDVCECSDACECGDDCKCDKDNKCCDKCTCVATCGCGEGCKCAEGEHKIFCRDGRCTPCACEDCKCGK